MYVDGLDGVGDRWWWLEIVGGLIMKEFNGIKQNWERRERWKALILIFCISIMTQGLTADGILTVQVSLGECCSLFVLRSGIDVESSPAA